MSLDHAILGFLSSRALSGYDLKQIFDTSVQHFWPADQSQIYRTLRRLVQRGWAENEVIEQADRPARKVYSLTLAGRAELERWLASELPATAARRPEMIQVFFAAQLSDDQALALFERAATQIRRGLAVYDAIPHELSDYRDYTQSPRTFYFWMLTLEIGKMQLQANLDWIEHTIQRIRGGEAPHP